MSDNNKDNAQVDSLTLILCLYGGKAATVERDFNPTTTTLDDLQQELRHVFKIGSDRETKLWIGNSALVFKPTEITSTALPANSTLSPSKSANNLQSASPIKLPPTPPPMPGFGQSESTVSPVSPSTPSVMTRQAAQILAFVENNTGSAIALPDSSTSIVTRSSSLTTSEPSSAGATSSSSIKDKLPTQTLKEAGLGNRSIVTLEAINADGTWPSSRPQFGTSRSNNKTQPGLCGLSNMGNTCFMNAALQCLSNTPPLTKYILNDEFVKDINTSNPIGRNGEIARTYADLIKIMWGGNNTSFMPREFKCAVSRFAPQFTGFSQQDCQELMAFLLDGLHEDLNRIRDKPYIEVKDNTEQRSDEVIAEESWSNYKKRNNSIIVDTFHAMLKSTLVCPGCQLVSVTFDPFCYLSLPLPVKREKQVQLTFLPKPSRVDLKKIQHVLKLLEPEEREIIMKYGGSISSLDCSIEEHAGCAPKLNRPKSCKLQVPKSGPASEVCAIVARLMNEEKAPGSKDIDPENLVVVELALGKVSKVYESSEHYNQMSDDIAVVEKASNYVLPLYLQSNSPTNKIYTSSKPVFLHVPDLEFGTLYKSVISSLSNLDCESVDDIRKWHKFTAPESEDAFADSDSEMECDDLNDTEDAAVEDEILGGTGDSSGKEKNNGESTTDKTITRSTRPAFRLSVVNSFGNHHIEKLGPNSKNRDFSSKLYLGAIFSSKTEASQFANDGKTSEDYVEKFTPKVVPKPTLQLEDCITQFTNLERLSADDPWYCPKCKKHQQATKKFDIWSLPKVLIIHLKRFSFSRSWRDKIDTLVEFPVENMDMSQYVLNPTQKNQGKLVYNLIGVANHYGGLGGGHYTAFAKNHLQNAWYSFDDAQVNQTTSSQVVTRSAYVLFYQLQEN